MSSPPRLASPRLASFQPGWGGATRLFGCLTWPFAGVDLVLNSLAEEKLQASVRCLAQHGRFLEIGKFDLSNNHPLGEAGSRGRAAGGGLQETVSMKSMSPQAWPSF